MLHDTYLRQCVWLWIAREYNQMSSTILVLCFTGTWEPKNLTSRGEKTNFIFRLHLLARAHRNIRGLTGLENDTDGICDMWRKKKPAYPQSIKLYYNKGLFRFIFFRSFHGCGNVCACVCVILRPHRLHDVCGSFCPQSVVGWCCYFDLSVSIKFATLKAIWAEINVDRI